MFLLVPAYPASPGQRAVKRLCVCDYYFFYHRVHLCFSYIGEFDLLMVAADFPSIAFCIWIVAVVFRRVRFVVFRIMSMMRMVYMIV